MFSSFSLKPARYEYKGTYSKSLYWFAIWLNLMPWNFKFMYSCDSLLSNCEGLEHLQISLRYGTYRSTLRCEEWITAQSSGFLRQIQVRLHTAVVTSQEVNARNVFKFEINLLLQEEMSLLQYWRSQWPRGLRRGSGAACLVGLRVRIPPEAWMSFSRDCYVMSGRCLCVRLIIRPEDSYRVWCV